MLLNDNWVKKENFKFLELTENENTYQNLQAMKAGLRLWPTTHIKTVRKLFVCLILSYWFFVYLIFIFVLF